MKKNVGKVNFLGINTKQIKVNRKPINNNSSINKELINLNNSKNEKNKNKLVPYEIKNIKHQEYLDQNLYCNSNIFTEFDALNKNPSNPSNMFKLSNLSPNDFMPIYNNTNGNITQKKNLNSKQKTKNNKEKKIIKNNINREFAKIRKITSYNKGNKRSKLHVTRSEVQYPLNYINQNYINKYQSFNTTNNSINNKILTEENNIELININSAKQKNGSHHKKIKKFKINSPTIPRHISNNKKSIRQNKSNFACINRRKNNKIISPKSKDINYLSEIKNNKSCIKSDNNSFNTYYSCYNFYQKNNKSNKNSVNYTLNMLKTLNNFGYLTNINSMEGKNKINSLSNDNIDKENEINYINIVGHDLIKNLNNIKINKNGIYDNKIIVNNIKNKEHQKEKFSANIINSNKNREIQLNKILNNNIKLINYQKKLIGQFCHCLEEFIFLNVKNNFDTFINKLKEYCKKKPFSSLLLKRIQNKTVQKNFFKEKASSYKNLDPNYIDSHFSSIIMMNNSNIINVQRKGEYIPNDFSKEYYGRKTVNYCRNAYSPPLTDKTNRMQKNLKTEKSHEILDINNIENYNYYNNAYFHNKLLENYNSFNNYNSNYGKKNIYNNINNMYINIGEDDEERKSLIKYDINFNENNLYVPKKFKRINGDIKSSNINYGERMHRIDDSDNFNSYTNITRENNIYSKKLSPKHENNRSHDINNNMVKEKINKNYNMNYLRKHKNNFDRNNYEDISCDTNPNFNINQNNDYDDYLNKTNEIIKRNYNLLTCGNTLNSKIKERKTIYKKKIKISQAISKINDNFLFHNNIRNKMINLNKNKTPERILSPKVEKNIDNRQFTTVNENFEKVMALNSYNISHSKNKINLRNVYTEPRREVYNNIGNNKPPQTKFGKIQELTVNLVRIDNLTKNNNLKNNENIKPNINNIMNEEKILEIGNRKNNIEEKGNDDNIQINQSKKDNLINGKNIEENNNIEKNGNEITKNGNNNNIENIKNNNDNNDNNDNNALSNDNNLNVDTEESDDNITKEIIVKDVSTNDKLLNVFIKYIELQNFNTIKNEFKNSNLLNCFQTDSIFLPSLFSIQRTNFYYNNYYYGNKFDKNNKYKLQKILTSIIEEEEKSKAAGSINNSYISEEGINKNGITYSHFYIQSIKYVSNFLQSIFDDKKRDMYFQFLKILKKIKNESFLRGLIIQKKSQNINKLKDDDNNTSEDVILYNANDNINFLGFKSNDRKEIIKNKMNDDYNDDKKNNKNLSENKNEKDENEERKYLSANNFCLLSAGSLNKDKNILKRSYSSFSFEYNDELNENKENKNLINNFSFSSLGTNKRKIKKKLEFDNLLVGNKLKKIVLNFDEFKKRKLIEKSFKLWKKLDNKDKIINQKEKKEDNDIQIDYGKKVTISEVCRGLSDVILDFKIYLVKFCLKKKKENNTE